MILRGMVALQITLIIVLIDRSPLLGSLQIKPMASHVLMGFLKRAANFWKHLIKWVNSLLRLVFMQ